MPIEGRTPTARGRSITIDPALMGRLVGDGAKRIRTADPLHAMQVLYQLSYNPVQCALDYLLNFYGLSRGDQDNQDIVLRGCLKRVEWQERIGFSGTVAQGENLPCSDQVRLLKPPLRP